jgi:hypothetical protein
MKYLSFALKSLHSLFRTVCKLYANDDFIRTNLFVQFSSELFLF